MNDVIWDAYWKIIPGARPKIWVQMVGRPDRANEFGRMLIQRQGVNWRVPDIVRWENLAAFKNWSGGLRKRRIETKIIEKNGKKKDFR